MCGVGLWIGGHGRVIGRDVDGVLHAGHRDVRVGEVLHRAAAIARRLHADARGGAVHGQVIHGEIADAILGDAPDGAAVADAERRVAEIDVAAAHGHVVVAAFDAVVAEEDTVGRDVDAVGVLGRALAGNSQGRDGDAGDGEILVAFDPDVLFGRVLQTYAADQDARRIGEDHFLRTCQRRVTGKRGPPILSLSLDVSGTGERNVVRVVGG